MPQLGCAVLLCAHPAASHSSHCAQSSPALPCPVLQLSALPHSALPCLLALHVPPHYVPPGASPASLVPCPPAQAPGNCNLTCPSQPPSAFCATYSLLEGSAELSTAASADLQSACSSSGSQVTSLRCAVCEDGFRLVGVWQVLWLAWRGVAWCGVVWCGVVWCCVAWRGVQASLGAWAPRVHGRLCRCAAGLARSAVRRPNTTHACLPLPSPFLSNPTLFPCP